MGIEPHNYALIRAQLPLDESSMVWSNGAPNALPLAETSGDLLSAKILCAGGSQAGMGLLDLRRHPANGACRNAVWKWL